MKYNTIYEVRRAILEALGGDPTGLNNIYEVDIMILKAIEEGGGGGGEGLTWNQIKTNLKNSGVNEIKFIDGSESAVLDLSLLKKLIEIDPSGAGISWDEIKQKLNDEGLDEGAGIKLRGYSATPYLAEGYTAVKGIGSNMGGMIDFGFNTEHVSEIYAGVRMDKATGNCFLGEFTEDLGEAGAYRFFVYDQNKACWDRWDVDTVSPIRTQVENEWCNYDEWRKIDGEIYLAPSMFGYDLGSGSWDMRSDSEPTTQQHVTTFKFLGSYNGIDEEGIIRKLDVHFNDDRDWRHYYPCVRNADGAYGMFCQETEEFIAAVGTMNLIEEFDPAPEYVLTYDAINGMAATINEVASQIYSKVGVRYLTQAEYDSEYHDPSTLYIITDAE